MSDILIGDESRLLREDIPERDVELVYSQMANIILQLFGIDFDRIGNLPTPKKGVSRAYTPPDMKGTRDSPDRGRQHIRCVPNPI